MRIDDMQTHCNDHAYMTLATKQQAFDMCID